MNTIYGKKKEEGLANRRKSIKSAAQKYDSNMTFKDEGKEESKELVLTNTLKTAVMTQMDVTQAQADALIKWTQEPRAGRS